jgi:ATP-dependent helicase/nuclease subunit A
LVALTLPSRAPRQAGRPASWFALLQRDGELAPGLGAVAAQLRHWKSLVDRLPPHDALDAIYHEGDVLARFAAAAPAPLRDKVMANLRALLGAALQVDGARYATPYRFVRALKAGGIQAPALSATGAVRLLTVHGAKGLEARVVLMLDSDGAPPRAESMGVVVEWPGEAPAPWRFAFIASETHPPACSAEALDVEKTARQREELNALYVAMTRARNLLVISSVQPYAASEHTSWWQRLQPLSVTLEVPPAEAPVKAAEAERLVMPDLIRHPSSGEGQCFTLRQLPTIAIARPAPSEHAMPAVAPDSDDSHFGQALHRLLEGWIGGTPTFAPAQLRRVAREFALSEGAAGEAAKMAQRILTGEGAWAWDAGAVDWQANEVPLHHQGELLRLDRLVRRTASGEWWVLDYKAAARPEKETELIEQLRRYRTAVEIANAGAVVKAAFLTGQGRLVLVP